MDNCYTVYVHISPSGKRYYGLTCQQVKKRWLNGMGYIKNEHFYRAIQKYGWDAFKHEIVAEGLTREEACALEESLIAEHHTQDYRFGYNISAGGEANRLAQSSKDKISEANKGKVRTEEMKRKMSEMRMGHPSSLKGGTLSEEHKKKISESLRGKPHPHKEIDTNKIAVVCNGIDYDSITNCAKAYGVPQDKMSRWLSGDSPVPDVFVEMGLSFKSCTVEYLLVEDSNRKMVEFDGVTYDTVNKCASAIGVAHHTISRWLNGKLKMPEYIKAGNLRYVKSYHYIAKKQKIKKGD